MVIFNDSLRTLNDQSITLLHSTNEPMEDGVVLKVHPPGSSVPSPSFTAIPCPQSLSWWWVKLSHELHDPIRKDLHVISRTFTLASNLHSTANHINPFPLLGRRISAGEVQWVLPSFKTPPLQYKGEFSYLPKYWEWLEDILSHNTKVLSDANLYEPLLASLFTYDWNIHVLQAFLECWCAAMNTLHTSVGEVSISLWDLHSIGGLPMYDSFYEEVVLNSKDISSLPHAVVIFTWQPRCILSVCLMRFPDAHLRFSWFFFFFFWAKMFDFFHEQCTTFSLKIGHTILFTHLKIILLNVFQFSVFSYIQMDPKYTSKASMPPRRHMASL